MIRPSIFNIIILLNFYFIIIGCKHTLPSQLAKPASTKPNSIQRESKYEVLFSTPQVTKCGSPQNGSSIEDKTINRKLESLIREAPEHSMIRCTLYSFTDKNIIDAIIKAHQRSVNIEILFDNKIKQSNYISTFNTLKPFLKDKVTACTKPSCARLIGNTHHKYCIFSKNRNNEENIIFQTTMNAKEVAKRFNDAIYITEDKELYDL
ncbi:MAG: phospholipase D-like domain-containing protein [Bdellovibrionota bacterium]